MSTLKKSYNIRNILEPIHRGTIWPAEGSLLFLCVCGTGVRTQGLHLGPLHQPFIVKGFFEIGFLELFAQAGFERDPPDLCLLSS
jgi:hypothetical protein